MNVNYHLRRKCPTCGSDRIYPSARNGVWELLVLHLFLLRPFRCHDCTRRYWGFLGSRQRSHVARPRAA